MRSITWAVLFAVLTSMGSADAADPPCRIEGEIKDDAGAPIPGAEIAAWTSAARGLRDPAMANGRSDERGRFVFDAYFADTRYTVWARAAGYEPASTDVMAGQAQPASLTLKRTPRHSLVGRVLDSKTRAPVADAQVVLAPDFDNRYTARTDASGRFELKDLPEYLGQGVVYAVADKRVSPYSRVIGRDREAELIVGPPATVAGRITLQGDGAALGGCRVRLVPGFLTRFALEAISADDGTYEITSVPPGEYRATALRDDLYDPKPEPESLTLGASEQGRYVAEMRRRVEVSGRVVGPDDRPVEGAVVAAYARSPASRSRGSAPARTDKNGAFRLLSDGVGQQLTIAAFASQGGYCQFPIAIGQEAQRDVVLRLSGALRVRGVVVDDAGRPVRDVRVSTPCDTGEDVTSSEGRFDLGWIPLTVKAGDDERISFRCPRPTTEGAFFAARAPKPGERFFLHTTARIKAAPGHREDITVALTPARVVTFSGSVRGALGAPIAKADVGLFVGNANDDTWKEAMHPERLGLSSYVSPDPPTYALVAKTTTDDQGRWTIHAIRETADSLAVESPGGKITPGAWSIGVLASDDRSVLMPHVDVPQDQDARTITINCDAVVTPEVR